MIYINIVLIIIMKQKGLCVISQSDLQRMEDLCGNTVNNDQGIEKQRLIELSNKRTRNWKDTIENKKRMKDQGRFYKFEREEKKRREIDRKEEEY